MLDRLFNWIDTSLAYRFSAALAYGSAVEVCLRFGEAAFSALHGKSQSGFEFCEGIAKLIQRSIEA